MIEPFCSEYIKKYRSFEREPEIEKTKPCSYYNNLGENFLPAEDSKTIYNPERDESVIKELHLKRLVSTYQTSYCSTVGKASLVIDPNNLEADQFMVHFNKYYAERTQPVLRPLETSRRMVGYARFSYYYTGKTEYEETISREGYEYFRRDYERGKSRLFGKKQEALKKLKNSDKERTNDKSGDRREEETAMTEPNMQNQKINLVEVEKMKMENDEKNKLAEKASEEKEAELSKEKICTICCEKYDDFAHSENDIANERSNER